MKNIVFFYLYVIVFVGFSTVSVSADERPPATYPSPVPGFEYTGDMNMNYVQTSEDAQLTFLAALGTWFPYLAGDCNGDDQITAGDAGAIFQDLLSIYDCMEPIPTPPAPLTPTPTPEISGNRVFTSNIMIGCPGDTMDYSVRLENPDFEIDCFGFEVHFNPAVISYNNCSTGDLDPGWVMFDCAEIEPGIVRAIGYTIPPTAIPSGSLGTLVDLTFSSICNTCYDGEIFPFDFHWLTDDLAPFHIETDDLEFNCINVLHNGDANLDHQVTSGDAQLTFMSVLGLVQLNFQQFRTADCNGDVELTSEDAQLIFLTALGTPSCVDPI